MGTILFLILRLVKVIDTPFDAALLCGLVSLDTVSLVLFMIVRKKA
ncbi:MAG TPA: hypothetical protein VJC03_02315 [bacterium]|nr:hypothetical protein [bacterium]